MMTIPDSHPSFLQRPDYAQVKQLTLQQLSLLATTNRQAGFYNIQTLWLYRELYIRTKSTIHWINYLAFRRDLGYPPNHQNLNKLKRLIAQPIILWMRLKARRTLVRQAYNLAGSQLRFSTKASYQLFISELRASHQEHFEHWLGQMRQSSIQVVGNSPNLKGSGLGEKINSHQHVIRFNHCFSSVTHANDIGTRTTAWCVAPGFHGPILPELLKTNELQWVILAGPDVLFWQQNFPLLEQLLKQKSVHVISIPLSIWQRLVRRLAAPPSAGLLVIELLRSLKITYNICGFGPSSTNRQQSYHHALPEHQAVSRHHWLAEHNYLQEQKDRQTR